MSLGPRIIPVRAVGVPDGLSQWSEKIAKKEKDPRPHCKVCGHNHFGICLECEECNRDKLPPEEAAPEESPGVQEMCEILETNPSQIPNISFEDIWERIEALHVKIDAVEKRVDAIDYRRKYQAELMRKRRRAAKLAKA